MKKILSISLLFFSLCAFAQSDSTRQVDSTMVLMDSVELKIVELPDSTAIAVPDGKAVSKEIDPAGGSIVSDDGRVELIFPEGALSAATTISIQPILNLIPNGNGKGYRFEPSGIQFQKPVQIIFHYSDEENAICPALLKFMAIQHNDGKWEYTDFDDWDSTTKSLKGFISHFSAVVNGNLAELYPREITLKVNSSHTFSLNIVQTSNQTPSNEDELMPLPRLAPLNKYQAVWLVNESVNGTPKLGTVTPKENKSQAIYAAPRLLPLDYLVTVKLKAALYIDGEKITRAGKRQGKMITMGKTLADKATFSSTVNLYDEYDVKIEGLWDNTNLGPFTQKWKDESSFKLRVGKDPGISDISNSTYTLIKENFTNNRCQFNYLNKETCKGPIHVSGIVGVGLSGGSASTAVTALVEFVKVPWEIPNLQITCPHGSVPTMALPSFPAIPHKMKFGLKTGTFNEEYSEAADFLPGGKITITLRQITEE
jgi:hypothetical protein